jgi:hypothetical protein
MRRHMRSCLERCQKNQQKQLVLLERTNSTNIFNDPMPMYHVSGENGTLPWSYKSLLESTQHPSQVHEQDVVARLSNGAPPWNHRGNAELVPPFSQVTPNVSNPTVGNGAQAGVYPSGAPPRPQVSAHAVNTTLGIRHQTWVQPGEPSPALSLSQYPAGTATLNGNSHWSFSGTQELTPPQSPQNLTHTALTPSIGGYSSCF